jgi:steroid delta-isomerase-like uncharacterized protein
MTLTNKEIARTLYTEVINGRQLDRAGEYVSDEYVEHEVFPGLEGMRGLDVFRGWVTAVTTAFPDFTCDVERICADGDIVMAQITIRGTHQGELFGIPATGRTIEVSGCDVGRFSGGKVVEHWGVTDQLLMLQQLGVLPAPGAVSPTAVHREVHAMFNAKDYDGVTARMTEGHFIDHARALTMKSPDEFGAWLREWGTALPDGKVEDATYYEAGNRSICVFHGRGTNNGPMGPFPATGNRVDVKFCEHLICDQDGHITGTEIFYDMQSLLVQLGHVPAPPS